MFEQTEIGSDRHRNEIGIVRNKAVVWRDDLVSCSTTMAREGVYADCCWDRLGMYAGVVGCQ